MKKPTPKMMVVLEKLAEPGSFAQHMPYMGNYRAHSYYFLHRSMEHCTAAIRGLLDRGLLERFDDDGYGNHKARISGFGRKYLRECKAAAE